MLAIRLKRMGTKKRPFYRLVVSDSRKRPTGRALAEVGVYDPFAEPALVRIDRERIRDWMKRGARPSETVRSLLGRA
jgi:small subunit ribosomal protein S16